VTILHRIPAPSRILDDAVGGNGAGAVGQPSQRLPLARGGDLGADTTAAGWRFAPVSRLLGPQPEGSGGCGGGADGGSAAGRYGASDTELGGIVAFFWGGGGGGGGGRGGPRCRRSGA